MSGLRVLVVVPWDQRQGGVASVVGNLARFLTRRGHAVRFLFPGTTRGVARIETQWGFVGYTLSLRGPGSGEASVRGDLAFLASLPVATARLQRILRLERISVVNVHYPIDTFYPLALVRWFTRRPLVVSIHGADVRPEGRALAARHRGLQGLLRAADAVVGPSNAFLGEAIAQFPVIAAKGIAIHNGLDESEFPKRVEPPRGALRVVCIAALRHKKGHDILLRAFAALVELVPGVTLELVGDGPERGSLEDLTRALGMEQYVEFAGTRPRADVIESLRRASLVVLPSRHEPFGIAAIEGMCAGRAVVASAVGGLTEIITDGVDGLLVPPEDVDALRRAMLRLLTDAALARRLGEEGRATVARRFTSERAGVAYESLFTGLAAGMGTG